MEGTDTKAVNSEINQGNEGGNAAEQQNAGQPKRNFNFSDPEAAGEFINEMAEKAFDALEKQSHYFEVATQNLRLQNENLEKQNILLDKLVRKGKSV